MKNNNKAVSLITATAILTASVTFLVTSAFYSSVLKARFAPSFPEGEKINEILSILDDRYYYGFDRQKLIDTAVDTMLDSLGDPYTTYMTLDEAKLFFERISGTYAGVGAFVSWDTELKAVIIVKPIKDSPAEKAGLVKGDRIVKIDGESVSDSDLDIAVAKMKGEKGTDVVLTVLKAEGGETIDIKVTRDEIHIPSMDANMDGDIGHLSLYTFDPETGDEFKENLNFLVESGAKGIVLDLRDNGGGIVSSVVSVANSLLNKGDLIFYTLDKDGNRLDHRTYNEGVDIPIVLLVNENTASAAELLAGALRDNKGIKLVGKTTYGKGVVQVTYPLSDQSVIKLTVEKYFTPNGNDIDKIGLKPDFEIELETESDEQYKKAVEVLRSEL
ncbi:MAG: Carboxy-terminal processing protease CtpA precursor [Firmicutes bacterium ADurb.Bin193]|nr:MAG: Carboxy-terminal processing protease CtpA precursor [Firmicutes bacterium ADurb.Bin193]